MQILVPLDEQFDFLLSLRSPYVLKFEFFLLAPQLLLISNLIFL